MIETQLCHTGWGQNHSFIFSLPRPSVEESLRNSQQLNSSPVLVFKSPVILHPHAISDDDIGDESSSL